MYSNKSIEYQIKIDHGLVSNYFWVSVDLSLKTDKKGWNRGDFCAKKPIISYHWGIYFEWITGVNTCIKSTVVWFVSLFVILFDFYLIINVFDVENSDQTLAQYSNKMSICYKNL